MKENILKLIKNRNTNFENLLRLSMLSVDELKSILKDLIEEKKIFLNSSNKYEIITDNLYIGTLLRNSKGVSYIEVNGEKVYILPEDLHTALKYDTVVVETTHNNYGTIRGIIGRKNNKLVCEVKIKNNQLRLVPFNGNCELSINAPQELLKDLIVGDRVYTILDDKINDANYVFVTNLTKISDTNDKFRDEKAIAISKGFEIEFSEEAMIEANNLPTFVRDSDKEGRVDLTDKVIYTIDSITTKDIDDAVSVERLPNGNVLLGVHIADVGYYIKPGSALFKEAKKRKTSVYIGDLVVPMFPSVISNGICSLNEGVERLARSTFIEYDTNGKVVNYSMCRSVIKSKKKMTYEDLTNYFNENQIDETYLDYIQEIDLMRKLASILRKLKDDKGYLGFESSDMVVKTDPFNNDQILGFENRSPQEADRIIEVFMIACNVIRATDFTEKGIPILYRIHDKPDSLKLDDTLDKIKELGYGRQLVRINNAYGAKAIQNVLKQYQSSPLFSVVSNLLLRSMAKARHSVENIGHFALGEDYYCHFTAPIRRFIDLMIQTVEDLFCLDYIGYNHIDEIKAALVEIAEDYNYKERQADDAEVDYSKLKMAQFMAMQMDTEFVGMILDIDKDKVFVKLDNNVRGILDMHSDFGYAFTVDTHRKVLVCNYSKQTIKLGSKLLLKVSKVDIPQKEVYFSVSDIYKDNKAINNCVKKKVRTKN